MADYELKPKDALRLIELIDFFAQNADVLSLSMVEWDQVNRLRDTFAEAHDQLTAGRSLLISLSP